MKTSSGSALDFICRAVATCFWIGRAPLAPATVCSLVVAVVVWYSGALQSPYYVWTIPVILVVGVFAAGRAERAYGHDGRQIVIDEVVGQMIAFATLPAVPTVFFGGFFFFRMFDILKPFPADRSQRLPGGLGVMADDVVAGVYANLALRLLVMVGPYT